MKLLNHTYLGIELGSTRIKAVAINESHVPASTGDYTWASSYGNGVWTYNLAEVWTGLKNALTGVDNKESIAAMGISGMMHGYLAFDKDWNLLVPFRTWQNTITGQAAEELTALFGFNIPQRWSIAHLYQAVLNGEEHISQIAHITTPAGYVHYMLTGVNAIGIGEASGMFPIDSEKNCYDETMLKKFDHLVSDRGLPWKKLTDILPGVLMAGDNAGTLTEPGAAMLDNLLQPGIPFAPAEGDAGTGMTATNAVAPRTGNVSAGTSIFSMVVLEKPLAHTKWNCKYHIVLTPKYRRKRIYQRISKDTGSIIRTLCARKGVEIIEAAAMPDHIHIYVAIPPKYAVSDFMGYLKGKSSLRRGPCPREIGLYNGGSFC